MDESNNAPQTHAGETRSSEHEVEEFFEFGGRTLSLKGTSGPAKHPSRMAEGTPIRHDSATAAGQAETRLAEGRPVQQNPGSSQGAAPSLTGSGQLIGGPVRRA